MNLKNEAEIIQEAGLVDPNTNKNMEALQQVFQNFEAKEHERMNQESSKGRSLENIS